MKWCLKRTCTNVYLQEHYNSRYKYATPFVSEITPYRVGTPRLTTYGLEGVFLFNSICGSRRVPEYFLWYGVVEISRYLCQGRGVISTEKWISLDVSHSNTAHNQHVEYQISHLFELAERPYHTEVLLTIRLIRTGAAENLPFICSSHQSCWAL